MLNSRIRYQNGRYDLFKDNKYAIIYFKICERGRIREIEGYTEKHHIIPKSLGRDSPSSPNLNLEYMGNYYWSYKELTDKTGCSKSLYLKYYKHGIDPTPRIGKDGPIPKNKENR